MKYKFMILWDFDFIFYDFMYGFYVQFTTFVFSTFGSGRIYIYISIMNIVLNMNMNININIEYDYEYEYEYWIWISILS